LSKRGRLFKEGEDVNETEGSTEKSTVAKCISWIAGIQGLGPISQQGGDPKARRRGNKPKNRGKRVDY